MGRKSSKQGRTNLCPTFRPTREQFSEIQFVDYVRNVFKKNPDLPMFKVVPPKGYVPHKKELDLDEIVIQTPIRQHAFGTNGAFMCILEEQPSMKASEFKSIATSNSVKPPKRGHEADDMLERAFWKEVTLNPPLYGADTPVSLFDEKVEWGWNLRNIDCLFKEYKVPNITGVTTPMTYFGSWRSFFGWHKEDCDLLSVNYLHFGAPKVWYCVSPRHAKRFDAMAKQLFPEAARKCPAFMRHKDVVLSPKLLRQYGVPFVQAKQRPGDFIVLNAAAYHSGFNLGFNCAEAVNFAVPEWMEIGRDCMQCECGALPDGVQLDMSTFFPGLYDSTESESEIESESEEEKPIDGKNVVARNQKRKRKSPQMTSTPTTPRNITNISNKRIRVDVGSMRISSSTPRTPRPPELKTRIAPIELPPGAAHVNWGDVADEHPIALVTKDPDTKELSFELVHRIFKKHSKPGGVWVGPLKQGKDGLYRPAANIRQEILGCFYPKLVRVRTEWQSNKGKSGGWKLTTLPQRILM